MNVDEEESLKIASMIGVGDFSEKIGWIRVSLHPTMTDQEVNFIGECIKQLAENHKDWTPEYEFDLACGGETTKDDDLDNRLKDQLTQSLMAPFVIDWVKVQ